MHMSCNKLEINENVKGRSVLEDKGVRDKKY
jgi:hypothetical protein